MEPQSAIDDLDAIEPLSGMPAEEAAALSGFVERALLTGQFDDSDNGFGMLAEEVTTLTELVEAAHASGQFDHAARASERSAENDALMSELHEWGLASGLYDEEAAEDNLEHEVIVLSDNDESHDAVIVLSDSAAPEIRSGKRRAPDVSARSVASSTAPARQTSAAAGNPLHALRRGASRRAARAHAPYPLQGYPALQALLGTVESMPPGGPTVFPSDGHAPLYEPVSAALSVPPVSAIVRRAPLPAPVADPVAIPVSIQRFASAPEPAPGGVAPSNWREWGPISRDVRNVRLLVAAATREIWVPTVYEIAPTQAEHVDPRAVLVAVANVLHQALQQVGRGMTHTMFAKITGVARTSMESWMHLFDEVALVRPTAFANQLVRHLVGSVQAFEPLFAWVEEEVMRTRDLTLVGTPLEGRLQRMLHPIQHRAPSVPRARKQRSSRGLAAQNDALLSALFQQGLASGLFEVPDAMSGEPPSSLSPAVAPVPVPVPVPSYIPIHLRPAYADVRNVWLLVAAARRRIVIDDSTIGEASHDRFDPRAVLLGIYYSLDTVCALSLVAFADVIGVSITTIRRWIQVFAGVDDSGPTLFAASLVERLLDNAETFRAFFQQVSNEHADRTIPDLSGTPLEHRLHHVPHGHHGVDRQAPADGGDR